MNSRLLHAAARGARIQVLCDEWEEDRCVMVWDLQHGQCDYRIHPDDAHMIYGPISSALREASEINVMWLQDALTPLGQSIIDCWQEGDELGYLWGKAAKCNLMQKQLFLLFVAEALADDGL